MGGLGMRLVPLASILLGDYEVRTIEDDPDLAELAASIANDGLINPLTVEQREEGLYLVAGHRRYSACILARISEVPVCIRAPDVPASLRVSFAENFHRRDVSAMEQAQKIGEVLEAGAMDVEQVAGCFRRSVEWVREQLSLLDFPVDLQEAVHRREIGTGAARQLAKISDAEYRGFLLRTAIENGVTERTASAWVQAWRAMVPMENTAGLTVNPAVDLSPRVPPTSLCMGCHEGFPPDGMVPIYVCPACVAILRERGLAGGGRR